jgi:uncharacterized membrane protein YvlD (DUF360 family)
MIRAILLFPLQLLALGLFLYAVAGGCLLLSPAQIMGML